MGRGSDSDLFALRIKSALGRRADTAGLAAISSWSQLRFGTEFEWHSPSEVGSRNTKPPVH